MNIFNQIVRYFAPHPIKIFLVDGLGAALSAFFLLAILASFVPFFGMPRAVLYPLAALPVLFALYSLSCYLLRPGNWPTYLKIVATANLLYCGISLSLVLYHFGSLTIFGVAYFVLEKLIVIPLAVVEFQLASSGREPAIQRKE